MIYMVVYLNGAVLKDQDQTYREHEIGIRNTDKLEKLYIEAEDIQINMGMQLMQSK
jgi:hypothetical protein